MDASAIQKTVKEYVLHEFLPGENPETLTESTPLVKVSRQTIAARLRSLEMDDHEHSIAAH